VQLTQWVRYLQNIEIKDGSQQPNVIAEELPLKFVGRHG
jgi:hypothetical protein